MSVLIKNMEIPKACVYRENGHLIFCPLYDMDGYCGALNKEASHKEGSILPDCPIVPVVRCKDCMWWGKNTHGCDRNPCIVPWWEDDFCSYGEKVTE